MSWQHLTIRIYRGEGKTKMDTVNLYILCEGAKLSSISSYQKALTNSNEKKQMKKDEIETLEKFVNELLANGAVIEDLDCFFYGFSIPQISKEFDLLKIYQDDIVINIELKSQDVELEKLEYQLKKNRYYLSHLNRKVYSFTYVKTENYGNIYSYNGIELVKSNIAEILTLIKRKEKCIEEDIETMFKAKEYLISPINTPDVFVNGNYYLTGQQEGIKNKIIKGIKNEERICWGIQGSAGTGKTLLLYDIAKTLSSDMKVCVIHSGILSEGHIELNSRLDNVDIFPVKVCGVSLILQYDCVLVDESQRLYQADFNCIINAFLEEKIYCIFAYDYYQVLSNAEMNRNIPEQLNKIVSFRESKLSEKIRTNREVASFIKNVINLSHRPKGYMNYRNIEVLYAENYKVAKNIIDLYTLHKGYQFISYTPSRVKYNEIDKFAHYTNTHHIIGQEFDNVIFSMDSNFRYTEDGHLQGRVHPNPDYIFYKLWFQGVSRAREKLCILVIGNEKLFDNLLRIKMQFEE